MITIDWATFVINVPRADLTLVQTVPTEIRELDINWFRLQLKDIEDSEAGMSYPDTHTHNTEVNLGGITYARVVEILDPYSITFEDGQYAVNLVGANSNVGDKINLNQVSVRSNNSAGLISSPAIEYSSFNGGVMVDINSGNVGTTFPRGTEQMPVNNMDDALLIASYRGFKRIYLKSDIVLSENYQLSGFELVGSSHVHTVVIIEPQAIVDNVTIVDCDISGTMDGYTSVENCVVTDLQFMNGHIHNSELHGSIALAGGIDAFIDKCSQLAIGTTPTIDMGVSGQNLVVTNYSGIIKITNFSGATNSIAIGLSAGYIILDSTTVKEGIVIISGIGELIDENGNRILSGIWNGGVSVQNSLINRDTMSEATELTTYVYIDTVNGYAGVDFPIGTKRTPSNNLPDAVTIANSLGIRDLFFLHNYTFSATTYINGFGLYGSGIETILTFIAGSLIPNCHFHNVTATGQLSGFVGMYDGKISNLGSIGIIPSSQEIMIQRTLFDGIIAVPSNYSGKVTIIDSYSNVPGPQTPTFDFGNCTGELQLRNYTGGLQFRNITQGNLISVDLISGNLKLENSVTSATIVARGVGKMVESATGLYIPSGIWNGGVIVSNDIMSKGTIAEAVEVQIGTEIEYASFNGEVTIDPLLGVTGTTYPIGTPRLPVKTLEDAKIIALTRGFRRLKFMRDFTFVSGTTLNNFQVYGTGMQQMVLTFEAGTDMNGSNFYSTTCSGVIINPASFLNCRLQNALIDSLIPTLTEVSAQECILQTEVGVTGTNLVILEFLNCWSFPDIITAQPPRINMNNSNSNINLRNHSGGIRIVNNNKPNQIRIYLNSGRIQLDSSITAGNFLFIGVGTLANNATSVTSIDFNGLVSKELVSLAVWDEPLVNHTAAGTTGKALTGLEFGGIVWLDPVNGVSGTTYPAGTRQHPSNNGPDALQIAIRESITEFRIDGSFTTTTNLSDYTIAGDTFLDDGLTFNNNIYTGMTFKLLHLDGVATFTDCEFVNCFIENIENFSGEVIGGRISNNISIEAGKTFSGVEIVVEGDNTIIDLQNQPCTVSLDVNSGILTFINAVAGCLIELNLRGGEVVLDSSCVGGDFYAEGMGTLYDNSAMTILDNHLLALEPIADYVWNKTLP